MANEIEVVAPEGLFRNTNEEVEDPSIVTLPDNNSSDESVNSSVTQYKMTWYSRTIAKVVIVCLGVFAVFFFMGYGSGYGISEKIISNHNKAAAESSAKNGALAAYDTPSSAAKASKGGGADTKSAKSTGPTGTKSSKSKKSVSYSMEPSTSRCHP